MAKKLVQAVCARCGGHELFLASRVGKFVECSRETAARFKLPRGTPFGADEWDACRVPWPLRQSLELLGITPPPRANAAFAIALVRAIYPKTRRVWLRKAVACSERFFETGTFPRDEMPDILDGLMQGEPP